MSDDDRAIAQMLATADRNYKRLLREQIEEHREALAEAWGDGYDAGHRDARAVQATYPEPTPNPYVIESDEGAS